MRKKLGDAVAGLVFFGGPLKAIGENKLGGYVALFTTAKDPDLEGEFFTKATDFYLDEGARPRVLYHHGQDPDLGDTPLALATVKADDIGLYAEVDFSDEPPAVVKWGKAQLAKRKRYIGMVRKLAKAKQLGWSIGSAPHLVERKAHDNGTFEFLTFPAVEISLSPVPIEPRTAAVTIKAYNEALAAMPVKAAEDDDAEGEAEETGANIIVKSIGEHLAQKIEDLVDDGHDKRVLIKSMAKEALVDEDRVNAILAGEAKIRRPELKAFARVLGVDLKVLEKVTDTAPVTIKGMFEVALAEKQFRTYELWSIYCDVVAKLVNASVTAKAAGSEFDITAKLDEATAEYAKRLQETVDAQIKEYIESDYEKSEGRFYLRALMNPRTDDVFESTRSVDIEDHLALVVSACESAEKRLVANGEARTKAGRELSKKNYDRFSGHFDALESCVVKGRGMLDGMRPSVSKAESEAARSEYMRSSHETEVLLRDLDDTGQVGA